MKNILKILLIVFTVQLIHTTEIPPIVFNTFRYEVSHQANVKDLFIDVSLNYSSSKTSTTNGPKSNRRYMLLGNIPNYGNSPINNTIASVLKNISTEQWQQGVYIYPYVVDEFGLLVKKPNELSNSRTADQYVALFDHNLKLLTHGRVSTGGAGQSYFGAEIINFPFQSFEIGVNNTMWYSIAYGTMLFLKAGNNVQQPPAIPYTEKLLTMPQMPQSSTIAPKKKQSLPAKAASPASPYF